MPMPGKGHFIAPFVFWLAVMLAVTLGPTVDLPGCGDTPCGWIAVAHARGGDGAVGGSTGSDSGGMSGDTADSSSGGMSGGSSGGSGGTSDASAGSMSGGMSGDSSGGMDGGHDGSGDAGASGAGAGSGSTGGSAGAAASSGGASAGGGDPGEGVGVGGGEGPASGYSLEDEEEPSELKIARIQRIPSEPPVAGSFEPGVILAINPTAATWRRAREIGLLVERHMVLENLDLSVTRFRVPHGINPWKALVRLRQMGTAASFDLNHYYCIGGRSGSGGRHDFNAFAGRMIGWPLERRTLGKGLCIGMVDSDVNTDIAALAGQHIVRRSFVPQSEVPVGIHGTGIAAVLVGAAGSSFPGLLPGARLLAAEAFSVGGQGKPHAGALTIARALDWLVAEKALVVNLSFCGPDNSLLRAAVRRTLESGTPLVAAAGNNGALAPPAFPAAYEKVIAVTAVDRFRRLYRRANQGPYIDFAAPGVGIWVPGKSGKGRYRQGTSYAAAYCTAVGAQLLCGMNPSQRAGHLFRMLQENTVDLGPRGRDNLFGWGLIHCPRSCAGKR